MKKTALTLWVPLLLITGVAHAEPTAYPVTVDRIPTSTAMPLRIMGDEFYQIPYIPVRDLATVLELSVAWQPETGEVLISGGESPVKVMPQSGTPDCWCEAPPLLMDNRVWVPEVFINREMGVLLSFEKQTIEMTTARVQWVSTAQAEYALVLDVRTQEEYSNGHLPGAQVIPVAELAKRLRELEAYRSTPILLYCAKGRRSMEAAQILRQAGFEALFILEGGYEAYSALQK